MSRIRTMIATAALLSLSSTNAFAAGTISGTVFNDYNSSGTFDTTATLANTGGGTVGIAKDVGVGGVTVTAYDGTGAAVGTATSAADGTYTLTATGTGPYRIEFTTIPSGFKSSFHGADSGTTVQFVANGVSTNVNLGITRPADYCQNNPTLVSSCYSMGNPLSSSNAPFLDVTGRAAIHTFPYASGALTTLELFRRRRPHWQPRARWEQRGGSHTVARRGKFSRERSSNAMPALVPAKTVSVSPAPPRRVTTPVRST